MWRDEMQACGGKQGQGIFFSLFLFPSKMEDVKKESN